MLNLKIQTYFKFILSISLISLISAYYIEYILGHQPCNLCLIERIPYVISAFLICISLVLKKIEKFFVLLLIIIFFISVLISFYHFGIEQSLFNESAICGLENSKEIITKEEILKQLSEKTISCKDVTFRILGLSLTTFNIVISLVIFILLIKIFKDYEKIKS